MRTIRTNPKAPETAQRRMIDNAIRLVQPASKIRDFHNARAKS
jgi:hypothetical protein